MLKHDAQHHFYIKYLNRTTGKYNFAESLLTWQKKRKNMK